MSTTRWYRIDGADLVLRIRVQARASRSTIEAVVNDRLRVRLTSPPVDGRANAQLCALIATAFAIAPSCIVLTRGARSREKEVRIRGCTRLPPALAHR